MPAFPVWALPRFSCIVITSRGAYRVTTLVCQPLCTIATDRAPAPKIARSLLNAPNSNFHNPQRRLMPNRPDFQAYPDIDLLWNSTQSNEFPRSSCTNRFRLNEAIVCCGDYPVHKAASHAFFGAQRKSAIGPDIGKWGPSMGTRSTFFFHLTTSAPHTIIWPSRCDFFSWPAVV